MYTFGVRGDAEVFSEYQSRFYKNVFFPELQKRGIKTIFNLGDTFDRRQYTNHKTLYKAKEVYYNPMREFGIEEYEIIGNHDTAFKNTNKVNAPELFLSDYKNVHIINKNQTLEFDGRLVHFIPWINNENYKDAVEYIKSSKPSLMLGHFDIKGFAMHKEGHISEHGIDISVFSEQEKVLSGHFHTQSQKGNIQYLGNPFEFTWADYDDPRGFWILETDTLEMEFVQNPEKMFYKLFFDGVKPPVITEEIENKYVKIIVTRKGDAYKYDLWLESVYSKNPLDVQVIEISDEISIEMSDDDIKNASKSTEENIIKAVESIDSIDDTIKSNLKSFLLELYIEAEAE